jgi:hypothetical protein
MYNITLKHIHTTLLQYKIHITHTECVCVALGIQHEIHMRSSI